MADEVVRVFQTQTKPIKLLKWKVRLGYTVSVGRVILTYQFCDSEKSDHRKLKASQAGTISKFLAQEGDVVNSGEALFEIRSCTHPTIMNDMCAECGADLRKDDKSVTTASVPMIHSIPNLKVSEEQAQKLGKADNERLIRDRKLVLLVDLDQTLIHTTNDNIPPNIKDVYHFQLYGPRSPWYHTRLRPGTHKFLNSICNYYELHICTFGARNYAHTIAMFLDSDQKFFSNRILSRDECFDPTSKKANLRALFPCGDDMVCIIDDREDVWSHALNLIHVKPYHFFQHTGDINAPPGLDKHEDDNKVGFDLSKVCLKEKKPDIPNTVENGLVDKEVNEKEGKECQKVNGDKESLEDQTEKLNHIKEKDKETEDSVLELVDTKREMLEVAKDNLEDIKDEKMEDSELKDAKQVDTQQEVLKVAEDNIEEIKDKEMEDDSVRDPKQRKAAADNIKKNEVAPSAELKSDSEIAAKVDEKSEVKPDQKDNLIVIEDPDDYLVYLEDILSRIHRAFYLEFDRMQSGRIPDLKNIIPEVRSNVLKGTKLVFSGLVPTRFKLNESKAYQVARSLGAEVTQDLEEDTTHLVAVRPGTAKVNAGRRRKNIKIVSPEWLWCCAERWEHVDERVFPLTNKGSKNRHPPPHCSSPEHVTDYPEHDTPALRKRTPSGRFMDTINPLMSFSSDDIADMDKEVVWQCSKEQLNCSN
ncbi:RNA polymerase II subunit A C-terminal domain phosphatase isoform X2 [Cylas formicarius]|uniref:RNA polymerase II subunit A C-terminal domain phosphatase isoform X2 n=1 Tax=Cylas formicarius TaxID=197179 RepID=UPI00295881B2|nr:RNA polymerase II subunit A C-terminal domain phosphatase isoform X2 [Cylas formicarius]